jgi:DNA primase
MGNLKKKDIEEVVGEVVELSEQGTSARPYLKGLCPFHDDTDPSFIVFPGIQKFICYSCHPELGDVVEFVKLLKGVSYEEAEKLASDLITPEEAFVKVVTDKDHSDLHIDNKLVARRIHMLHEKYPFEEVMRIMSRYDVATAKGQWMVAESILRKAGV